MFPPPMNNNLGFSIFISSLSICPITHKLTRKFVSIVKQKNSLALSKSLTHRAFEFDPRMFSMGKIKMTIRSSWVSERIVSHSYESLHMVILKSPVDDYPPLFIKE